MNKMNIHARKFMNDQSSEVEILNQVSGTGALYHTIHYPLSAIHLTHPSIRRCVSRSSVVTASARVELIDLTEGSSEGLNPGCSVTV